MEFLRTTIALLIVPIVREADEGQVVSGERLRFRKRFVRTVVFLNVVEITCVDVTAELRNDGWYSCEQKRHLIALPNYCAAHVLSLITRFFTHAKLEQLFISTTRRRNFLLGIKLGKSDMARQGKHNHRQHTEHKKHVIADVY